MKSIVSVLIISFSFVLYAQDDYFIVESDTTFCSNLEYKLTGQSYLKELTYQDINGETITIEGRKNIPNISTFYINDKTIDKIPQKTNKPDKYIKWAERVVDGKLIINYYSSTMTTYTQKSTFESPFGDGTTTGISKFYIKLPDGVFYNILKSSDRKNHIIPYLKKCEAFNSKYTGEFKPNYDKFIKTVELYNSLCK